MPLNIPPDVILKCEAVRLGHYHYLVFKVAQDSTVSVDFSQSSAEKFDYKQLQNTIASKYNKEPRLIALNYKTTRRNEANEAGGTIRKMIFISWMPNKALVTQRMSYAAVVEPLKKHVASTRALQAEDVSGLDEVHLEQLMYS